MGQKLLPHELALYRATDEVLHYIWDPIGMAGSAYARDEYHGYLPKAYSLLVTGDILGLRDYLADVSLNRMGLEENAEQTDRLNRTIAALEEWKLKCAADSKTSN